MKIYRGCGYKKEAIGEYENGCIYRGTGWSREAIGEYENGIIYKDTGFRRMPVGEYQNGGIFQGTGYLRDSIGEYEQGVIYADTGWRREAVGEYSGDESGAAAFLLLLTHGKYLKYDGHKMYDDISNSAVKASKNSNAGTTTQSPSKSGDVSPAIGFIVLAILVVAYELTKEWFPLLVGVLICITVFVLFFKKCFQRKFAFRPKLMETFGFLLFGCVLGYIAYVFWYFADALRMGIGLSADKAIRQTYLDASFISSVLIGISGFAGMMQLCFRERRMEEREKQDTISAKNKRDQTARQGNAQIKYDDDDGKTTLRQTAVHICGNCKTTLRYPINKGKIRVTCPMCGQQWIYPG